MEWYRLSPEATMRELGTNLEMGLTQGEAEQRLQQYGPNELVERGAKPAWQILLDQFKGVMVIVLIVAAIISGVLGEWLEVIVILAIVVLNAILGFTQEYRAEKSMAALKKMGVPSVRARRDGHILEISSTQLVPGDIVLLEMGNIVPADGRLLINANLKAQESALTGESEPVEKSLSVSEGDDLPLGDRLNMLYMGTAVTYGRGEMAVTGTGMGTELGHIANLIQEVEEDQTPLQGRLANLAKILAWAALAIVIAVMAIGWAQGTDLETLFLTGISLAVAAIPESLPAVVTITLALGAQRLLKRHALIRNLPAVETLGSVTVICSDKTGTLTENRMSVTILDVAGNTQQLETTVERHGNLLQARLVDCEDTLEYCPLGILVRAGALCNDAVLQTNDAGEMQAIGDPTEAALVLAAQEFGLDKAELEVEWARVAEIPFTSERKRMTTIHRPSQAVKESELPWRDATFVIASKGGVDSMLEICSQVLVDDVAVPLDESMRQRILEANASFAGQGQRVLAVSIRRWDRPQLPDDLSVLEEDQTFVGMVAMMDPPRPEVRSAVKKAKAAGIRPVMITGDHPLTALQIAKDLDITQDDRVLTGRDLAGMSIEDLEAVVEEVQVYARVAPEHKLNIIQALGKRDQFTAMTGDGVNDAPALKQADIGVAMGITGTDVSKQAADVILLDDNFATIVAAVEEGRSIFDNIRKFIKYTLASNIAELGVMLIGPFLGMALPLLPLQILWINLVTDGLPGVALANEEGEKGTMERSPFSPKEGIFSRGLGTEIIWVGILLTILSLGIGYLSWKNDPNGPWQSMLFTTLVLGQMANALAFRANRESVFSIGFFSNQLMIIAILSTIALQAALLYLPFLQRVFRTQPLDASHLLPCILAAIAVLAAIEVYKFFLRRKTVV